MPTQRELLSALFLLGILSLSAFGQGVREDPRDQEARDEREVVRRAFRENCLMCHSEGLVTAQRLTPRQWTAEVEKMIGWGAPLPAEMRKPVIDFLAAEYPETAPAAAPARRTVREALAAIRPEPARPHGQSDPSRGQALYARHCANCHGGDGQGGDLGTNLVEKPVLLRPSEFADVIRRGRGRMPGFVSALDSASESEILAWLRTQRFRPREGR